MVSMIVPGTFGLQEVSLVLLLKPYIAESISIVPVLLIKVVFIVADLVWGFLGWIIGVIGVAIIERRNPLPSQIEE